MSEQTLKPPPVARCPKCGFPSGAGESCEACGASLPVVRPYLVSGPPLAGLPPIKREATGGWLAPVLVIFVSISLVLGGLWYYFAPQIAALHQETVITDSVTPPPSPAAVGTGGMGSAPEAKPSPSPRPENGKPSGDAKSDPPGAVSISVSKPAPRTAPAPASTPAPTPAAQSASRTVARSASESAPAAGRETVSRDSSSQSQPSSPEISPEAAAQAQALVASVGRFFSAAGSSQNRPAARPATGRDRKDSVSRADDSSRRTADPSPPAQPAAARSTPDLSALVARPRTSDPNAPIVLGESSFTTGRAPAASNGRGAGRAASLLNETRRAIAAWGGGVFVAPTPFPTAGRDPDSGSGNGSKGGSSAASGSRSRAGVAGAAASERGGKTPRPLIEDLTDYTFSSAVNQSATPVVVDFWAPWCGPCRRFQPVLVEAARAHAGRVRFARVNADENKALVRRYAIEALPTVVVFRSGAVRQRHEGAMDSRSFEAWLDEAVR